jgi:flagellar motor switch protein FliG
MANIKSTNLRFNLDKEIHRKAWEYLQNMDKSQLKSYTHAIAVAVVNYFEREQSDTIANVIESALERLIPKYLAEIPRTFPTESLAEITDETISDEIDFDFLGG